MKKIILTVLALIIFTGCSIESTDFSNVYNEREINSEEYNDSKISSDIIIVSTESCVSYFSQEDYIHDTYKVSCNFDNMIFLDTRHHTSKFPKEKRKKLYELANFNGEYDTERNGGEPYYALNELLCINISPSEYDLLPGDVVTLTVGIQEGINLTIEQVEETLGCKFTPFIYTVE